ncbi:MAG: hypothetical protein ACI35Q_04750 [Marinilabiliaceae bacterium]
MRKKLLTIAALVAAALPAVAGETDVVTVEPLTGAAYSAAIARVARVTFTDDAVRLISAADGTVIYSSPIAETSRVSFGQGTPTALADAPSANSEVRIVAEPATRSVRTEGLTDGSPVMVHSLSGTLALRGAAPTVSLSGLQPGLYIVVAGNAAARVTVK